MILYKGKFRPSIYGGKEEDKDKDKDKNSNYVQVPKADHEQTQKDLKALGDLRNAFPEEFRGKEAEFFKDYTSLGARLKDIEDKDKTVLEKATSRVTELEDQIKSSGGGDTAKDTKITELTSEVEGLKLENHSIHMYGHIGRHMQLRNVYVPEEYLNEDAMNKFDLSQYDLSDEKGVKKFGDDLWKTILEPAHNRAVEAHKRMGGVLKGGQPVVDNKGGTDQDRTLEQVPALTRIGQNA